MYIPYRKLLVLVYYRKKESARGKAGTKWLFLPG
jgi:hypothetical protein